MTFIRRRPKWMVSTPVTGLMVLRLAEFRPWRSPDLKLHNHCSAAAVSDDRARQSGRDVRESPVDFRTPCSVRLALIVRWFGSDLCNADVGGFRCLGSASTRPAVCGRPGGRGRAGRCRVLRAAGALCAHSDHRSRTGRHVERRYRIGRITHVPGPVEPTSAVVEGDTDVGGRRDRCPGGNDVERRPVGRRCQPVNRPAAPGCDAFRSW